MQRLNECFGREGDQNAPLLRANDGGQRYDGQAPEAKNHADGPRRFFQWRTLIPTIFGLASMAVLIGLIVSRQNDSQQRTRIIGGDFSYDDAMAHPRFHSPSGNQTISCNGVYERTVEDLGHPCLANQASRFFSTAKKLYPPPRMPRIRNATEPFSQNPYGVINPGACNLDYALSLSSDGVNQFVRDNITSAVESALQICSYITDMPVAEKNFWRFFILAVMGTCVGLSLAYCSYQQPEEKAAEPMIEEVGEQAHDDEDPARNSNEGVIADPVEGGEEVVADPPEGRQTFGCNP